MITSLEYPITFKYLGTAGFSLFSLLPHNSGQLLEKIHIHLQLLQHFSAAAQDGWITHDTYIVMHHTGDNWFWGDNLHTWSKPIYGVITAYW